MVKKGELNEEILFRNGKIQGLNRVVIPIELLEQVGLKEGDGIKVYLNTKQKSIILKKERGNK